LRICFSVGEVGMSKGIGTPSNPFESINRLKLSMRHIKVWFTAGMGFFTDAYDLFIIGAIISTIVNAYNYARINIPGFTEYLVYIPGVNTKGEVVFWTGLLASSAIWTAILGQLIFGRIADVWGRKKVYGVEAALLSLGALFSAFAPNLPWLIALRSIMGFGIGGDYPVSSVIMSEYANVKDRGKLIALVFANQGIGTVVAVAVGMGAALALPPNIAWRVMAGIGAIPAALVIYLRRTVPETPRFSLVAKGDVQEAKKAAQFLGADLNAEKADLRKYDWGSFLRNFGLVLLGTASTWFILDIAFYGTGVFSGPIVSALFGSPFPKTTPISLSTFQSDQAYSIELAGLPFLVGFFGYFTAVALMDKLGRKVIQILGYVMMAVLYAAVASLAIAKGTSITGFLIPTNAAFAIYALTFFFIDFGPNTTTFVVPAEAFPTNFRTTAHGISAASGKLGAAITTYLFPTLLATIGVKEILYLLAGLSIVGAVLTLAFVPETKDKALEEIGKEVLVEEISS
jgi:Arabinose efflux permease